LAPTSNNNQPANTGDSGLASSPPVASPAEHSPRATRRGRWIAFAGLFAGYALLSQYSATASNPHARSLGAALSIGPVILILLVLLWVWRWRVAALIVALSSGALLYLKWPFIERHYEWSDLAQQFGIYGLVAIFFARSLFAGRVPVCDQLARQMYGALTPAETAYMRRATAAWAVFYFLLTAAVLILFFAAPLRVWSLFTNFVTWGLMVFAGFVDHALRQRVLPRHRDGGILTLIRRALTT
jgi:uncharacterized membrane protein